MLIFTPTIQHTGTWFLLRFLEHYIPNIVETWKLLQDNQPVQRPAILHTHFPVVDSFSLPNKKSLPLDTISTLANLFPTVIPIRDPLRALLTRECRHPEYRHFYIVDGFVNAARMFSGHPNVVFLPIDLPLSADVRRNLLASALAHCGLIPDDTLGDVAEQWPVHNPTPCNRFQELYDNGDWDTLQVLLGAKNAELDYLRNKAAVIKPFLASLGYTRLWP